MKITCHGESLDVTEIDELVTSTANSFQSALRAALPPGVTQINLDLSQTDWVDCGGLGALVALRKGACKQNGSVNIRLINPTAPVRRLFALLRLDQSFPIEQHQLP
jgi:anti-anti-sigma factor